MYGKILLTVDGSELAKAAIPHAAELARDTDTEVVLLEVTDTEATLRMAMQSEFGGVQQADDLAKAEQFAEKRDAGRRLETAAAALKDAGVRNVRTLVREAPPNQTGNVIVDTALEEGVGAVVMSTRGHSGLGREVVGSVAEYVLRHAGPVAVLLVGPRSTVGTGPS